MVNIMNCIVTSLKKQFDILFYIIYFLAEG